LGASCAFGYGCSHFLLSGATKTLNCTQIGLALGPFPTVGGGIAPLGGHWLLLEPPVQHGSTEQRVGGAGAHPICPIGARCARGAVLRSGRCARARMLPVPAHNEDTAGGRPPPPPRSLSGSFQLPRAVSVEMGHSRSILRSPWVGVHHSTTSIVASSLRWVSTTPAMSAWKRSPSGPSVIGPAAIARP
jgi:hypothetical protein